MDSDESRNTNAGGDTADGDAHSPAHEDTEQNGVKEVQHENEGESGEQEQNGAEEKQGRGDDEKNQEQQQQQQQEQQPPQQEQQQPQQREQQQQPQQQQNDEEKHQQSTSSAEKSASTDSEKQSSVPSNGKSSSLSRETLEKKKDEIEKKMKQSFKLFGIEFAPVIMPIERRLQTLFVLITLIMSTACPVFMICTTIFLLFTPLFFIPLIYVTWMYLDRKTPHRGGRRYEFMRRLPLWRYFRDYFPISMTKTSDLNPKRNYIFAYHPHGFLSFGAMLNFGSESNGFSEKFPGIKPYILTLNTQFIWPLLRAYLMSFGLCAVSKDSIKYILTHGPGHAVIIVVGGAEEALEARPGSHTIVLLHRKGFIRQAILYGADLVPCYSFGENEVYEQLDNTPGTKVRSFQEKFKRIMSFSPPFVYGRGVFNYSFGLMPFRRPIDTVIGKPIQTQRDDHPTDEVVNHYHQLYMDSLYNLFEEHKSRHGIAEDVHLKFI